MRLNRYILPLCVAVSLASLPKAASAFEPVAPATAIEEAAAGEVKISVNNASDNQEVRVQDADGKTLEIYNVLGMRIATYRIDSVDKTFTLGLQRGCYILKVGKVVRKTFIR